MSDVGENKRETLLLRISAVLTAIAVFAIMGLTLSDAWGPLFTKWIILLLISYGFSVMAFYPRVLRIKYQLAVFLLILLAIAILPDVPWQWEHYRTWKKVYMGLLGLFSIVALFEASQLSDDIDRTLYSMHLIAVSLFAGTWYL